MEYSSTELANLTLRVADSQRDRQVLFCITSTAENGFDAQLNAINQCDVTNLALLLIDPSTEPGGKPALISDWSQKFGGGCIGKAVADGRACSAAPHDVPRVMEELVYRTRAKLMEANSPARVEDPALAERAKAAGIPTQRNPRLTGPGEEA